MPEYPLVTVQADTMGGTAVPKTLWESGRKSSIIDIVRQWDQGRQRYFDIRLDEGRSAILRLDRRSQQWHLVDAHGQARPT